MSDESTAPQNAPQDVPPSGSRWEPRTDASGAPTPQPVLPAEAERAVPAGDAGPEVVATPAAGTNGRPSWTTRVRGRGGLLAGAAALVLVAGVGGFAVAEVAHHPDGGPPPFGVGYQPQDARFPGLPGGGDDDGGFEGHGPGQGDGQYGGQLSQPGGSGSDDDSAQQGSSL
jgi:hypothetical protein